MTDGSQDVGIVDDTRPSLAECALQIVAEADLARKISLARSTARRWRDGSLSLGGRTKATDLPSEPGRPTRPVLLPPREMPRRSAVGEKGRVALLHALAHIELNAVDMTWDLIGRFIGASVPRSFFDDWVRVGDEEAFHFSLLAARLKALGAAYGDLPAHAGLWQAAQSTGHDLLARLAVVPLVLEARGLDVSPSLIRKLEQSSDLESASIIAIIYRDEKRHVAFGMRWFRYLCEREGRPLEATFHALVRENFRGPVKPPFNDRARSSAGLTPGFYKPLSAFGNPA